MNDPFSAISRALPPSTRVFGFRGTEALSTLYRFEIYLYIEELTFDMAAAVGADATLVIHREEALGPILFHGIIASIKTVGDHGRGALYRAVLVPRLHKLTLTHHSFVYVSQSMPEILEAVLERSGLRREHDYILRLSERYAPYEHVCQYRESNFAFLSRRMEREGVYYFFEQEEGRERLVITDNRSFHRPFSMEPVRFVQVTGAASKGGNGIRTFVCEHTSIPGRVRVQDYDYLKPALDVSGEAQASGWQEEIFLHAENAVTPDDSLRLARLRAEELLARQVVFQGTGRGAVFLRTGYTFAVEDHPRFDGDYLATELHHRGKHGGLGEAMWETMGLRPGEHTDDVTYHFDVVAISARVQHRPERSTPVPRLYGFEKAVVDGELDHHYAQIDEHGRYLVKILFDESPLKNGKASTRIRMMQPHGGNPESFHFPLRKGTEVFLSFDGGDPDRPFIAGVVPNTLKPTKVTAANYTKNVLETGGRNRFQIEDLEGKQHVRLWSPHLYSYMHLGAPNGGHNAIINTDGYGLNVTGKDSETGVGGARLTAIGDALYPPDPTKPKNLDEVMNPILYQEALAISRQTSGMVGSSAFKAEADATVTTVTYMNGATVKTTQPVDANGNPSGEPTIVTTGDPTGSTIKGTPTVGEQVTPEADFDLNLTPTSPSGQLLNVDPDGRGSYRTGSDIKFVGGDNVTKVGYDDLKVVLGDEIKHDHQASISHIDGGALTVVTPTTTNIDILKTSLYVSQFSIGVTNVSLSVFSTTQSLLQLKNHGLELSTVLMKIIS